MSDNLEFSQRHATAAESLLRDAVIRADTVEAELTRLRAREAVLVEIANSAAALVEWVNLVEILRYEDGTKLAALVKLENALVAADLAMPATLATLDVPDPKEQT